MLRSLEDASSPFLWSDGGRTFRNSLGVSLVIISRFQHEFQPRLLPEFLQEFYPRSFQRLLPNCDSSGITSGIPPCLPFGISLRTSSGILVLTTSRIPPDTPIQIKLELLRKFIVKVPEMLQIENLRSSYGLSYGITPEVRYKILSLGGHP